MHSQDANTPPVVADCDPSPSTATESAATTCKVVIPGNARQASGFTGLQDPHTPTPPVSNDPKPRKAAGFAGREDIPTLGGTVTGIVGSTTGRTASGRAPSPGRRAASGGVRPR
ncbi:hypothetical protein GCM10022247_08670 [Allokutzneria multivorans]|uniref:Uncharacterized protein n=1 Tax=Allokutzneria multivorans TaxID=1142134 RepID=A0ABP7R4I1_9PSEU